MLFRGKSIIKYGVKASIYGFMEWLCAGLLLSCFLVSENILKP